MAVRTMGRVLPGTKAPTKSITDDITDALAGVSWDDIGATGLRDEDSGGRAPSLGSILSGQASLARAAETRRQFDIEQAAKEAAIARQRAGAQQQLEYLRGQLGAGIPSVITGELESQQRAGEEYIQNQAAALLKQLQEREAASRGLTQTGYSNLMNYLARNQPTAFAQAQRVMPTVTESQLGQYMAGQGVSPAAAQEAATLANIQAAGGASNYNQLLNVLAAREQAGQTSRQAEAEMGLATQLAQLQGLYGAATGGLEQSRLSALADLANRISAARLQSQREAAARDQAIQDAIASLLASGLVPGGTTPGGTVPGGTVPGGTAPGGTAPGAAAAPARPIDALAARMAQAEAAGNNRLANRIEDFIAANPNAGINRIAREFPQIAETIRNTQVPTPYSAPASSFPLMGFE